MISSSRVLFSINSTKSIRTIHHSIKHVNNTIKSNKVLHQPVMTKEVLQSLYPDENAVIVDMTFGAGGHTKEILEKFKHCKVIALDRDPLAHSIAVKMSCNYNNRIIPLLGRFSELDKLLQEKGINSIDGALIDAGSSSMQLEESERGFSVVRDGPLDMRMDGERFPDMPTAADVVNRLCMKSLTEILKSYGEEQYAAKISQTIINHRQTQGPITTSGELAEVVENAFNNSSRRDSLNRRAHVATKTFMALRIFVNDELNELNKGLKIIEKYMRRGGRLVAITFHSLEDRIVKRTITGITMNKPPNMSLGQQAKSGVSTQHGTEPRKWMFLHKKLILPQFEEIYDNKRSRSAKLRAATRL